MDREKKIELVQKIVDFRNEMDECDEKFAELFGGAPSFDEGMGGVFSRFFDHHSVVVSEIAGIKLDSLSWFIFENGCGGEKMTASFKGVDYVIDSVEAFVDFESLEDDCKEKKS